MIVSLNFNLMSVLQYFYVFLKFCKNIEKIEILCLNKTVFYMRKEI